MTDPTISKAASLRLRRLLRLSRLLVGRNQLRRPYDRIEGAVLVILAAAFLMAVAGASILGAHIYQSQRAGAAGLSPATAVVTQNGPVLTHDGARRGRLASIAQAQARWPARGGQERSGTLTAVIAPGILGAAAGTRIPVWLNRSGQPAAPPPGRAVMILTALLTAVMAAGGAAAVLLIVHGLCRYALDRRRLTAWEAAWTLIGPRWTSRH
jgi:hypothetical protein